MKLKWFGDVKQMRKLRITRKTLEMTVDELTIRQIQHKMKISNKDICGKERESLRRTSGGRI